MCTFSLVSNTCGDVLDGLTGRIDYTAPAAAIECSWTIRSRTSSNVTFHVRDIPKDLAADVTSVTHSQPYARSKWLVQWNS